MSSYAAELDERNLAWFPIRIKGTKPTPLRTIACFDTGATYTVLNPVFVKEYGLRRPKDPRRWKTSLITVAGEISVGVYIADRIEIAGTQLYAENIEVIAKKISGFPCLLGMNFLSRFEWCFDSKARKLTISLPK